MEISVVVPAFNGGRLITDLFLKISNELSHKYSFEVLFIFDYGSEETRKILEILEHDYPELIRCYYLAENYGQHRAIQLGLGLAEGNYIITMDEDLQHSPSDIHKLVEKQINGNYDIVYGRFSNMQNNCLRNLVSAVLRKTLKLLLPKLSEYYSPYRLIKKEIGHQASKMIFPYIFIDDFLSRITDNIAFVDIMHSKRNEGRSSYTILKLIKNGLYILLAYSRLIFWLLLAAGISILSGVFLLIISVVYPDLITSEHLTKLAIIKILGIGLSLIIISLTGIFVNHRNVSRNSREVKLRIFDEDPV